MKKVKRRAWSALVIAFALLVLPLAGMPFSMSSMVSAVWRTP